MKIPSKKNLMDAIVRAGIAPRKTLIEVDREAKAEGASFEEILLKRGIVTAERLAELKAAIAKIPPIDLTKFIDPLTVALIPESMIRKFSVLPLRREEGRLVVGMADPWDLETIELLKKKTNLDVTVEYAPRETLMKAFDRAKELGVGVTAETGAGKGDEESSVIRLVDTIIRNAIRAGASDIHIEPQENDVIVRYRIDGILRDITKLPRELAAGIIARVKVLANLKLDEHRLPQDGRFKMQVDGRRFSFRTSIMPVFDGEKAELRILEEETRAYTLEELGFTEDQKERIHRSIALPFGMILATGPTGSGKTTTLYTLLRMLNKREVNIVTAEDPVEYRLHGINQTHVRPEIGLSFANALRSLLRQDPNIIMVGEIRDNETAGLAINAALTGHIVLSTLHTNDAPGAIPRLLDMKIEGFLIASTVRLIIAQRLVRRLCFESRVPYKLTSEEFRELAKAIDVEGIERVLRSRGVLGPGGAGLEDVTWYRPGSIPECPDGYKGRIAISEVLEVTERIRELIFRGANADEIRMAARAEGMITVQEAGFLAAAKGITSIEEVLRAAKE